MQNFKQKLANILRPYLPSDLQEETSIMTDEEVVIYWASKGQDFEFSKDEYEAVDKLIDNKFQNDEKLKENLKAFFHQYYPELLSRDSDSIFDDLRLFLGEEYSFNLGRGWIDEFLNKDIREMLEKRSKSKALLDILEKDIINDVENQDIPFLGEALLLLYLTDTDRFVKNVGLDPLLIILAKKEGRLDRHAFQHNINFTDKKQLVILLDRMQKLSGLSSEQKSKLRDELIGLYCVKDLSKIQYPLSFSDPNLFSSIDIEKALEVIDLVTERTENYFWFYIIAKNLPQIIENKDLKKRVWTFLDKRSDYHLSSHEKEIIKNMCSVLATGDKTQLISFRQKALIEKLAYSYDRNHKFPAIVSFRDTPVETVFFTHSMSNKEVSWKAIASKSTLETASPNAAYFAQKTNIPSHFALQPGKKMLEALDDKSLVFYGRKGRTLLFQSQTDGKLYCIKFKKKNENFESLENEANTNHFLQSLKEEGELQSDIPHPIGLTNEAGFIDQFVEKYAMDADPDTLAALKKELAQIHNICEIPEECYIYSAPSAYFDYLHQKDPLKSKEANDDLFKSSLDMLANDLVYLLKNKGLVNATFADIQHETNADLANTRDDKGRYFFLNPVMSRSNITSHSTAGCIENLESAVEFINASLGCGMRDNELISLSQVAKNAQDRLSKNSFIKKDSFKKINYEMQAYQSLSDYQLALFLTIARRANESSKSAVNEEERQAIWLEAASLVNYMMASFIHHMTGMPLDLSYAFMERQAIDPNQLAQQMRFFWDKEYMHYLPDTKCTWNERPDDEKDAAYYDKWQEIYGKGVTQFVFDKERIISEKRWDNDLGVSVFVTTTDLNDPSGKTTKRVSVLGTDSGSFPILAFERGVYEAIRLCETIAQYQLLGMQEPWRDVAVENSMERLKKSNPNETEEELAKFLEKVMEFQRRFREEKFEKKYPNKRGP
jgi:hypothetical protein